MEKKQEKKKESIEELDEEDKAERDGGEGLRRGPKGGIPWTSSSADGSLSLSRSI